MASPYSEPVYLRDDITGELVRDGYGNPIIIGEAPIRPPMSYMATPPMGMGYMSTPAMVNPPMIPVGPSYYAARPGGYYSSGAGCCAGGLAGLGCCICCDSCCDELCWGCNGCCDCYGCCW